MLIVLDGPEKVGKSTLARQFAELSRPKHAAVINFRHHPGFTPSAFLTALQLSSRPDVCVIMDRSWASDVVYSRLVRNIEQMDWWYEWTLRLPAMTLGETYMVLPNRRLGDLEKNDHILQWETEWSAFFNYANKWKWTVIDPETADVKSLFEYAEAQYTRLPRAPKWMGSRRPKLVYVGQAEDASPRERLAWGPLTTRPWKLEVGTRLSEIMSAWPDVAAVNAEDVTKTIKRLVHSAKTIVAYGQNAAQALKGEQYGPRALPTAKFGWDWRLRAD